MRLCLSKKYWFLLRVPTKIAIILALLAPGMGGFHLHSHGPDAVETCADGGTHIADHPDAPDLSLEDSCPACTFRFASLAILDRAISDSLPTAGCAFEPHCADVPKVVHSHADSRAPPLV